MLDLSIEMNDNHQKSRRMSPRLGAKIVARFFASNTLLLDCIIEDFCALGLFISYQKADLLAKKMILSELESQLAGQGELIIQIHVENHDVDMVCIPVRFVPHGIGVQFKEKGMHYFELLKKRVSEVAAAETPWNNHSLPSVDTDRARVLLDESKSIFQSYVEPLFLPLEKQLKKSVDDSFSSFSHFRDANDYRFECNKMFKNWGELKQKFIDRIDLDYKNIQNDSVSEIEKSSPVDLSLVDNDFFDRWLIFKILSDRIEHQYTNRLSLLSLRFQYILSGKTRKNKLPFHPDSVCKFFSDAISFLNIDKKALEPIAKIFSHFFLRNLGDFYDQHNAWLEKNNIKVDFSQLKKIKKNHTTDSFVEKENLKHELMRQESVDTLDTDQKNQSSLSHSSSVKNLLNALPLNFSQMIDQRSLRGEKKFGHLNERDSQRQKSVASSDLLNSLDEIFTLQRERLLSDSVLNYVESLFNEKDEGQKISEKDKKSIFLFDRAFDAFSLGGNLLGQHVPETIFLKKFLLQSCLENDQVFFDEKSIFNTMLDKLFLIASMGDEQIKHYQSNLVKMSEQVNHGDIHSAIDVIKEIYEQYTASYVKNISRIKELYSGRQKVSQANQLISDELLKRVHSGGVPKIFYDFILLGWRDLMRLILLRKGKNSPLWQNALSVMDELLSMLQWTGMGQSYDVGKFNRFMQVVTNALGDVQRDKDKIARFFKELEEILSQKTNQQPAKPQDEIIRGLKLDSVNKRVSDQLNEQELSLFSQLTEGVSVHYTHQEKEYTNIDLCWKNYDNSVFVFVDQKGAKLFEKTKEELITDIKNNHIQYLGKKEESVISRTVEKIAEESYLSLVGELKKDVSLGLKSRFEFERCLRDCCNIKEKNNIFVYFSIKHYQTVCQCAGFQAGTQLIQFLSNFIIEHIKALGSLFYTNTGEFFAIFSGKPEKEIQFILDEILKKSEHTPFVWEKAPYQTGFYIGMIIQNECIVTVDDVLELFDSFSLNKKNTWEGIYIHRIEKEPTVQKINSLKWVAKVGHGVYDKHLKLKVQKIAPLKSLLPDAVLTLEESRYLLPRFEVLVEAVDQEGFVVPTQAFIDAAESYQRIVEIDRWIVSSVLQWMKNNEGKMRQIGGFSVNLSGHSLNDDSLLQFLFEEMNRVKVVREKLTFEITETTAVKNLVDASDFIQEIKRLGCFFAIDDFGAGMASYAYLKQLPVDYVKIDGMFVRDLDKNLEGFKIFESMVKLIHSLNKKVVAEFVATEGLFNIVTKTNVDFVQGYYIAKPIYLSKI